MSGTRLNPARFLAAAPLALSLKRLRFDTRVTSRVFADNAVGLSALYNQVIESDEGPDVQIFMHDDVWIDDTFVVDRILEGLEKFDVLGVAGSRRRLPNQVTWAHDPKTEAFDKEYLSGTIAHGRLFGETARFGPAPQSVQSLDGVFLAVRRSVLRRTGVRFDPQFPFHFYDLDFCRTALTQGLQLGTWPIVLTHASLGNYSSASWAIARDAYLAKWGD